MINLTENEKEWYTLHSYPNYEINKQGIVKNKINNKIVKSYILTTHKNSNRPYKCLKVNVSNNGWNKNVSVHRLLAETFIPKIEGKDFINHKDGNSLNNDLSNLEWCNNSENIKHAYDTGLLKPFLKGKSGKLHHTSIPIICKDLQGNFIKKYENAAETKLDGFNSAHVTQCCKGKEEKHKGFKFEYDLENTKIENVLTRTYNQNREISTQKPVLQFTLNNEFIKEWKSTAEPKKDGFSQPCVAACARAERAKHGGFIWKYK